MSIFTTMRAGVSVLPPPASRLPTVGEGASDSFSSLVNGRMPAPDDNPPSRLSIYNAISAGAFGALSEGFGKNASDVTNDLPSPGGKTDDEISGGPAEEVTNKLPLAGYAAGSDGVSNDLPEVDVPDDEVGSPIGSEDTVTNELPRIQL